METYTVKQLWDLCCKYDGISPDSKFVAFSLNNPYVDRYNKAMELYLLAELYYRKLNNQQWKD